MTRNEVIAKVKVKLEELSPFSEPSSLLAVPNNEVKPIHSYINDTLDKAYDDILLVCPLYMILSTYKEGGAKATVDSERVGHVALPDDFLRLHTIHVVGWRRDINQAISEQSPLYKLQRNKYTRGKTEKPVVVVRHIGGPSSENKRELELYSVMTEDENNIDKFYYIPKTAANTQTFEDSLTELLVMQCACKVAAMFEETAKVEVLTKEIAALMQSLTI